MIALYLLTLTSSAGIAGLFAYRILAEQGFVPVLRAGIYLAGGVACAYITIQTLYMLLARVYKPTKDRAPLFFETLSHAATVLLLPYVLRVPVPWPHPALQKAEVLLYLAAFLGLHGAFKLLSFFAAMRGRPAPRVGALGWLAATAASALLAYGGLAGWADSLEGTRPSAADASVARSVAGQHAPARPVPEGAQLVLDLSQEPGRGLTLLWARDPDAEAEEASPERIHVVVQAQGDQKRRLVRELKLAPEGWTALRLAPGDLPPGARSCRILWNAGEAPKWQRFSALSPVLTSNRSLLVAGPAFWEPRTADSPPNLVIVAVDGIAGHRQAAGVSAESLGALKALSEAGVVFENAYTPAPDAGAASLSLLTGLSPLQHGYLEGRKGVLPEDCLTIPERLRAKGYVTAAFTGGQALNDLVAGTDFGRGFDLFDDGTATASAAPALSVGPESPAEEKPVVAETPAPDAVDHAIAWMDANSGAKFMAFVRLAGLAQAEEKSGEAVRALDRRLAALLRRSRKDGNTCVLVTSPRGYAALDTDAATPADRLTEGALHVPCVLYAPGLEPARHKEVLSLEDLAPVLLRVLNGATDIGGKEPAPVGSGEAVSVCGDPLALSVRSDKWRFTWQTELALGTAGDPGIGTAALYDVERMRKGSASNQSQRQSKTATSLFEHLQVYLQTHAGSAKP